MDKTIFGMPSLVELDSVDDNVRLCTELGLDFIELNMNLPQFQLDRININRLLEIKENYHIFFTFHLPEELDIANFNYKIRKTYMDIISETIEISKYIGSPIINMHINPGTYFKMPDTKIFLYEKFANDFNSNVFYFQEQVDKSLANSSTKLSIENTGIYKFDFVTSAVSQLLKSESFSLTWDVGHDHSSSYTDRIFIDRNKNKLKHMHLHDGIGNNNHLPLFSGEIDLCEKLRIANETNSSCVIETKTTEGLRKSVSELNKLFNTETL